MSQLKTKNPQDRGASAGTGPPKPISLHFARKTMGEQEDKSYRVERLALGAYAKVSLNSKIDQVAIDSTVIRPMRQHTCKKITTKSPMAPCDSARLRVIFLGLLPRN